MWKYIGIGIYLVILLAIGAVAAKRTKDARDYFAGGKKLGFWAVAFSSRATGESAWLLLGLTGMGATIGARGFFVVLGELIGVAGAWLLLSRRFHRLTMRYDSVTIPDYLESRFRDKSHKLRMVAAGALVLFVTIYVSAQIDATGKAFQSFLGTTYLQGALTGFAVVLAYSVTGGFLAVVWSDIFQGTLMLVGLVALPAVALFSVGGPSGLIDSLNAIDPNLLTASGGGEWNWTVVCGTLGLAMIGLGFLGSPQIFVRFLALRDEKEISKGAAVAVVWTLLADSGAVLVGMIGRAALTGPGDAAESILGGGGEDVLPLLVEHVMPAALIGLYVAIVLSAIMSTVDSLLVLAGSAAVRDYYQRVRNPQMSDKDLLKISRRVTFCLALIALAVALTVAYTNENRSLFWFIIFGWSGIAATFCPMMILSLFWRGMTARGALAAMITGIGCIPLFKFSAPNWPVVGDALKALTELPPSFALSLLAGVLFSLGDKSRDTDLKGIEAEIDEAAR